MFVFTARATKAAVVFAIIVSTRTATAATMYFQTNLTSDIPGLAAFTDPNLVNPWGMSFGPNSPFWTSNQATSTATLYNGAGQPQPASPLVVAVPPFGPTGQVFNSTMNDFVIPGTSNPATFIFATLSGTINAWNFGQGTTAAIEANVPMSVFTGLALANNGTSNFLYAANFKAARIDVFNSNYALTSVAGNFTDPTVPEGYAPFNIEALNGQLYVTYAQVAANGESQAGPGLGFVSVFDANGNFIRRLISNGALNAPWGLAIAPSGFGDFSNQLLVGNFGDGTINAFDTNGNMLGTVSDSSGNPIEIEGLWAIKTRTGGPLVNTNALYFTAGIDDENHGLFGDIQVVPEPGALGLACLGLGMLSGLARRARARRQ